MGDKDDHDNDFEVTYFRYCRDANGNLVPVDVVRRNGRVVPRFPPEVRENYMLPEDTDSADYIELLEEVCQCLNDLEKRRWLLAIRDWQTNSEIAAMEGVTRQAIIDSFHRMALKNPYVRIWLANKNKRNQHS
jgi:hypothetical protein